MPSPKDNAHAFRNAIGRSATIVPLTIFSLVDGGSVNQDRASYVNWEAKVRNPLLLSEGY